MEIEERTCSRCVNSKPRTDLGEKYWWYCSKHKTFITDLTRPEWIIGCKGKDYKKQ